ncbi:MAG TPA: hypothetical protein PLS81_11110 [Deltaproteobacteria bacterium]|nr:hypothetical protein [Deltaproteobacteria bacterium]
MKTRKDVHPAQAGSRSRPAKTPVEKLFVTFNGETVRGYVLAIDARTGREKEAASSGNAQPPPVIVFFPGHAQRPDDAFEFTGRLAWKSRSGIVIVPVCDTPHGDDPSLRGDDGKVTVLVELVRHACAGLGLGIHGQAPQTGAMAVALGPPAPPLPPGSPRVMLAVVGWSHGAILARRVAHAYPGTVVSLAQVCPAGYEATTPGKLTARFVRESASMVARAGGEGRMGKLARSAWGFTKGLCGDFARSIALAGTSLDPSKVLRVFRDIHDCTTLCDSTRFKASHLRRIAVFFGASDTLMAPIRLLGTAEVGDPCKEDLERFRRRFFADVPDSATIRLGILPGTHAAPVTHAETYADAVLEGIGEGPGKVGEAGGGR